MSPSLTNIEVHNSVVKITEQYSEVENDKKNSEKNPKFWNKNYK